MSFLDHNRALLLAGAVALVGATACSRSDRADAGRDTTQSGAVNTAVTPADTQTGAAGQTATSDTASATSQAPAADTGKTAVTTKPKAPRTRMHPGTDSAQGGDQGAAGYQEMGRDTTSPSEVNPSPPSEGAPADSSHIRPTPDSGLSAAPSPSDTASVEMSSAATDTTAPTSSASDTTNLPAADSTSVAVADSAGPAPAISDSTAVAADPAEVAVDTAEVAVETPAADTTVADSAAVGYTEMARDTTSVLAQVDTAAPDAAAPADEDTANIQVQADTAIAEAAVGGDSVTVATGDANVATADSTGRIRPPEDSTEIAASESSVDAAGAAPMGGGVTGVDAVATMTRAGARCVVVRDDSPDVFWDMADSPAALNPCGTGTMTLSLVRTGETR